MSDKTWRDAKGCAPTNSTERPEETIRRMRDGIPAAWEREARVLRAALERVASTPTYHPDAPRCCCPCAVCIAVSALRETEPQKPTKGTTLPNPMPSDTDATL